MLEKLSIFRRSIYNRLPQWLKRHDFEVFAAFAAIFSGIPILFGRVQPSSIEALLPTPVVYAWATVLVVGGISVLVGIVAASRSVYPDRLLWMRVEALGLTGLAYFCYIYVICIVGVAPDKGWTVAIFVLTFGFVSHVRKWAIFTELDEYRSNLGVGR